MILGGACNGVDNIDLAIPKCDAWLVLDSALSRFSIPRMSSAEIEGNG